MELREFAEQVLFATTLEGKLARPGIITDDCPGAPMLAPPAPGRPLALRFRAEGSAKPDFPGVHRLEQPQERGRLLHFFGNHELLATELMALALLRFPEAPPAFRRGVLQTLKDEQEHTRLYVQRMRDSGLDFGDLPVSGFFWRCVAPMENPIDYVATLCLTFEQANLDFARHFGRGFQMVGDAETARLLDRVYHDEIGHVAYGLKWFRRWKHPDESDWEAFCRALKFPLSPRRARGQEFNVEGRRAAGFDPAFIAELEVYSQSKGRTPTVFVFNPFAEGHLAQGRAFTPTRHQAQLAADLENLMQFLACQDDVVLVRERPGIEFLRGLSRAGFPLPEFVASAHPAPGTPTPLPRARRAAAGNATALTGRKLGALRPWAWSPDSVELLGPLFAAVTGETRPAERCFNDNLARLYSKAWSAAFLRKILELERQEPVSAPAGAGTEPRRSAATPAKAAATPAHSANAAWLCTEQDVGVVANTCADVFAAIAAIRARGHHRVVVKEAIGLAGRNALRLSEPDVLESQRRWIARHVEQGRELVIEPWLERELDFSAQLEMTDSGLEVCGYTGLINDGKGQYQGNWAAPNFARRIPAGVLALLEGPRDLPIRLRRLYERIFERLEVELRRVNYVGPIGIDAFVYRTSEGHHRLKPVVEINPRYTMGRVTVELMKRTCPGSHGRFRLLRPAMVRAAGYSDFADYVRSLTRRFPLELAGDPVRRIRAGALCLNDPARAQVALAVFEVGLQPLGSHLNC